MGDFNLPRAEVEGTWDCCFLKSIQELGLTENIGTYTRHREGQNPSKLDYVLTSEDYQTDNIETKSPLGKSDHLTITFSYLISLTPTYDTQRTRLNFSKTNYDEMNRLIALADWRSINELTSVDKQWEITQKVIQNAISQTTPISTTAERTTPKHWLRASTKRKMTRKRQLWSAYQISQDSNDYTRYKKARNECVNLTRRDNLNFKSKKLLDMNCPNKNSIKT